MPAHEAAIIEPLLRAVIRQIDGRVEAQLLELDIAVCAESEVEAIKQISYQLSLQYRIARERNQTPFAALVGRTPAHFADWWGGAVEADRTKEHSIDLPDEVLDALAIALHRSKSAVFATATYALAA